MLRRSQIIITFAEKPGVNLKPESINFLMNAVHVWGPQTGPIFRQQSGSTHSGWNWNASFFWARIPVSFSGPPSGLGLPFVLAPL